MKYETIINQCDELKKIIGSNKDFMSVLKFLDELDLPNFYIVSGAVFQMVWNHIDGKALNENIKDLDIVYCDRINTSREHEDEIERKIYEYMKSEGVDYLIDIHNEGRMHLWKKDNENPEINEYENAEDAINQWIFTVQAVGVTMKNGNIEIYAPYGLSDVFSKTLRPIKHKTCQRKLYDKKIESYTKRFDGLEIIPW